MRTKISSIGEPMEQFDPADDDPSETAEWLDALDSVYDNVGGDRAAFLLTALSRRAGQLGIVSDALPFSPYRNTIRLEKQVPFPGDIDMEERITAIIRWNALAMVMRANKASGELGGHIASISSAPAKTVAAATSFSSSRTPRRAFTPAPSSRAACRKSA